MKNYYSGLLSYVAVYETDDTPYYALKIALPIGHGIRITYEKSSGNIQHSHALVDTGGNALTPGGYNMQQIGPDYLVIISRSIH